MEETINLTKIKTEDDVSESDGQFKKPEIQPLNAPKQHDVSQVIKIKTEENFSEAEKIHEQKKQECSQDIKKERNDIPSPELLAKENISVKIEVNNQDTCSQQASFSSNGGESVKCENYELSKEVNIKTDSTIKTELVTEEYDIPCKVEIDSDSDYMRQTKKVIKKTIKCGEKRMFSALKRKKVFVRQDRKQCQSSRYSNRIVIQRRVKTSKHQVYQSVTHKHGAVFTTTRKSTSR